MIESTLNQHFQSDFVIGNGIVATKLINSDPDLIKKFKIDQKRSKIDLWLNLIERDKK